MLSILCDLMVICRNGSMDMGVLGETCNSTWIGCIWMYTIINRYTAAIYTCT